MSAPTFSSRAEAVADVVRAIEAAGVVDDAEAYYDVAAICDDLLGDCSTGYAQRVDSDEFWRCVARHERPAGNVDSPLYLCCNCIGHHADDCRKPVVEQLVDKGWSTHARGIAGEIPGPVLRLLAHAIWSLEDNIDFSDGDRGTRVLTVVQAIAVVERWLR